jgi:hypothetical protein
MKITSHSLVGTIVAVACTITVASAADPNTTSLVTGSVDKFHPALTTGQHALVRDSHLFFEEGNVRTAAPEGEYTSVDGRVFIVGKKGAILASRMP